MVEIIIYIELKILSCAPLSVILSDGLFMLSQVRVRRGLLSRFQVAIVGAV